MSVFHKYWNMYRSYVIMAVACILLLFMKSHVLALLDKAVMWLQPCSHAWFAVLITGVCLALSIVITERIKEKKQRIAHSTLAAAIFVVLTYTYFRFIDVDYEFWGISWYKWSDILYLPFVLLVIQKIVCGRQKTNNPDKACLHVIDKPIEDPSEDRLGHDWMSDSLMMDLETVDVSKKSFSVGILGIWGQGKSSFLNLFKRHARKQGSIIVEFYPRASKSIKSIQEDFFNEFKTVLSHYHTGVKRYISNYAREVAEVDEGWVGKLALVFNTFSADKEMARINKVIASIGRRIYVVIEDFDRLTGEEILEVLKLMERNGDFCNTVFLTAYDKEYVNEVIGKYLKHSRTHDYTDKYFDFEYSLPVNSQAVLSGFAQQFISEKVEMQENDKISKAQLVDAWNVNGGFIVQRLGTMRHIKRYLNVFMSRYPKVKNDVDASDFMILTLLRYKDLKAYNAVFDFRFLRRGSLYADGTPKLIYLQNDYTERLQKLQISDESKEVIERMFHKSDDLSGALLESVYNKIEWADSFSGYFFDFRIGKYHYEDFQQLFTTDEETALSSVEKMQKEGLTTQVTDFLKSRNETWFVNEEGLARYIQIVAYLDSLERTMELDYMLSGMLLTSSMEDYIKAGVVKEQSIYKETVKKSFEEILQKCPMEIGFACQRVNEEVINDKLTEQQIVFSLEELVGMAVWAQKYYYQKYESGDYLFNAILNLAKVNEKTGDTTQIAEAAKQELVALMKLYPEQFAKDLVISSPYTSPNGMVFINLRFNDYFDYEKLLKLDDFSLDSWVEALVNPKMKYVLRRIYETGRNDVLQVPSLKPEYEKGDFDGFYAAVKAFDNEEDDKKVLIAIQNQLSLDYSNLCDLTGISLVRAKESVERLVAAGSIAPAFKQMKELMETFEKGDYVKFRETVYGGYTKNVFYSDNVFRIIEIKQEGLLRLSDIENDVPQKDVEAIPIDGIHDRNIYYDPIIAASYVAPGQPIPVHKSPAGEYYMEGLERTRLDKKTLKSIVEEHDCRFVHEVQHCLKRVLHRDDLKLDKTIKSNL